MPTYNFIPMSITRTPDVVCPHFILFVKYFFFIACKTGCCQYYYSIYENNNKKKKIFRYIVACANNIIFVLAPTSFYKSIYLPNCRIKNRNCSTNFYVTRISGQLKTKKYEVL